MKLINLEGLTLFGPGSEWLWSMLQLVVVAVSLIGLYRQVRLQSSAGAIEQATALASDWNSEALHRSRLAALLPLRDGVDQPGGSDQATVHVGDYWERVGWLVRSGHIDRRIVYAFVGNRVRLWWTLLAPNAQRLRELQQDPGIYEHFEWLANTVAAMDREAGYTMNYDDDAYRGELIEANILRSQAAIQQAEELRAVLVHPLSTAVLAPTGGAATRPEVHSPDPAVG
ncbi:MAG: hypothetical protein EPO36_08235 [Chloroflexota bacterium]|nr:MAG: hypothetical protein EPO36_08235 [Chloroflexota bacterium]